MLKYQPYALPHQCRPAVTESARNHELQVEVWPLRNAQPPDAVRVGGTGSTTVARFCVLPEFSPFIAVAVTSDGRATVWGVVGDTVSWDPKLAFVAALTPKAPYQG
jgi:hypothetical protein